MKQEQAFAHTALHTLICCLLVRLFVLMTLIRPDWVFTNRRHVKYIDILFRRGTVDAHVAAWFPTSFVVQVLLLTGERILFNTKIKYHRNFFMWPYFIIQMQGRLYSFSIFCSSVNVLAATRNHLGVVAVRGWSIFIDRHKTCTFFKKILT